MAAMAVVALPKTWDEYMAWGNSCSGPLPDEFWQVHFAAPCKATFINPVKGNGLVATRDIKQGECVAYHVPKDALHSAELTGQVCSICLLFTPTSQVIHDMKFDKAYEGYQVSGFWQCSLCKEVLCANHIDRKHLHREVMATTGPQCDCKDRWVRPSKPVSYHNLFYTLPFNHSCAPNVESRLLLHRGVVCTTATKSILAGEELERAYIGFAAGTTTEERLAAILDRGFSFACQCKLCQQNLPTPSGTS
jgi:hypothetical protein